MIKIYTTLISDFEKRVKEKNREIDELNMNEKKSTYESETEGLSAEETGSRTGSKNQSKSKSRDLT